MIPPLRVVPLGGLGEVGMNCLALERGDDVLVVDVGVMFPGEDVGINVIHPDLSYLASKAEKIRGLVITHGHEDHIGAVPYFLKALDVPIFGPAYALGLIAERLGQHDLDRRPRLDRLTPGEPVELGPFSVTPIRVTHSTADCLALAIQTPEHLIVHSGDFRFDPSPVDGEAMDVTLLGELGGRGVDLLLSDSTNIEMSGSCGSEQSVAATLEAAAREAEGRVFIAAFSSNTPRMQLLFELAEKLGRKVVLAGRSVLTHTRIAEALGYLRYPAEILVPLDRAESLPAEQALFIVSGTQGEPLSALGRLAAGRLHGAAVEPGDLVAISGRFIPGNELSIYRAVSDLSRRGARVLHSRKDPGVHVSGHAHRDEQRKMLELVRPRAFVPVHGAYHHLAMHAELARQVGVSEIAVVEDGEVLELRDGRLSRAQPVFSGRVHVDGVAGVSDEVLRDRRMLRGGVAVAVLVLDPSGEELAVPPLVMGHGVGGERHAPDLWASASAAVAEAFEGASPAARRDAGVIRDLATRSLRRYLARTLDRRPASVAVVVTQGPGNGQEEGA